eukprot:3189915-Prymnesium_polylepis.1
MSLGCGYPVLLMRLHTAVKEKQQISDVQWDSMSQAQRDAKCSVHIGQCHQHLRNIIINAMQLAATEYLKTKLVGEVTRGIDFSPFRLHTKE